MADTFKEFLPALLGPRVDEIYGTDQMATKHQELYAQHLEHAATLPVTDGTDIVVFASSDRDNAFNREELDENVGAANALIRNLRALGIDNPVRLVEDFSRRDFNEVLADPSVGHMAVVGHTKRSGVFVPGDPILWKNAGPRGHLKQTLGLLGCGVLDRHGITPRFGYNLVDPDNGILYGMPEAGTIARDVSDLGTFSHLPVRLRETASV